MSIEKDENMKKNVSGETPEGAARPAAPKKKKYIQVIRPQNASSKEVKTTLERENCCPFAYRCPFASDRCKKELPGLRTLEDGHRVRCFLD